MEQGVRYLVDQEGVDLIATGEEVVGDAHEIFDDHGEFIKTESGRAFGSPTAQALARRCSMSSGRNARTPPANSTGCS